MADDARILELVEEALSSQLSAEDVCAQCPELLDEVRAYLLECRNVNAMVERLFPSAPAMTTPTEWPPSTPGFCASLPVAGRLPVIPGYEVLGVLGRGGMGIIYRARHLKLNRVVALKMLLSGEYASPAELARFAREGEAIAALQHPNIVQVYDVGEIDGRAYFTMELVGGGTLAAKLAGVPQPAQDSATITEILARAIHAAHAGGIVHRDLKPGNILLTADGTPKISDFGQARHFEGPTDITLAGAKVGTPSYMAPEQVIGKSDTVGPAADIYALGATLYELLTGRPPFRGETSTETQRQVVHEEPAAPSRLNAIVPHDLETICLKCLRKERGSRYATALDLADDLKRFNEGRPILARPIGWAERSWRWSKRNPTAAALLLTAVAFVGLASGGGVWLVHQRAEGRAESAHQNVESRTVIRAAVAQAERLRKAFQFGEARAVLERARGPLEGGWQRLSPESRNDLKRQMERAGADLKLAERLDRARINAATLAGGTQGLAAAEALYVSAFADAGLGGERDDIKTMSARVRNSSLSAELIAALDDWASITVDQRRREWLLAVAGEADRNPARNRLRQPELWRDGARLTQIAKEPIGAEVSPQLAIALSRAADRSDGDAIPLLAAVQSHYPQDFWVNFGLGATLGRARRLEEALGYDRAALAIRPDLSAAHSNLGGVLYILGRLDEAIGHFREAVRLDPNYVTGHINLGIALHREGLPDEAMDHLEQTLRLDPQTAVIQAGMNGAIADTIRTVLLAAAGHDPKEGHLEESERPRARQNALGWLRAYLDVAIKLQESSQRPGWSPASWQTDPDLASVRDPAELAKLPVEEREQWKRFWADVAAHVATDPFAQGQMFAARLDWVQAVDCYVRAAQNPSVEDGHFLFEYAALSLLKGDRPGYTRRCERMIELHGKSLALRSYHVARACTLAPESVADLSLVKRMASKELRESAQQFWSLTEQGALAYRAGRFQDAVLLFERSLRANPKPGAAVLNWLWLSLADERLGKTDDARQWLEKAQQWLDQYRDGMPPNAQAELGLDLHNWLEANVLRREAEALLSSK
jgi:serine/threonine-protein kinase